MQQRNGDVENSIPSLNLGVHGNGVGGAENYLNFLPEINGETKDEDVCIDSTTEPSKGSSGIYC